MSENQENGKKFVPADEMEFPAFKRVQETVNLQKDLTETSWEVVRDDCESGGAMDERCNVVAASLGSGSLDVVAKRLSCGCLMVRDDIQYSTEASE